MVCHPQPDKVRLILACSLVLLASCIGPANPKKDAAAYLREMGQPDAVILAVTEGKELGREDILNLQKCPNSDVRHLVAKNSSLLAQDIDRFISDDNWFVRAGVALNRGLDRSAVERLSTDTNRLVRSYLVMNPSVPEPVLLRLFRERDGRISLSFFAMNPRCPSDIAKAIENSDDEQARHILKLEKSDAF